MALANRYGSADKARAALKKSAGGGAEFLWRLKPDESWRVRFLQELEDWYSGAQHYIESSKEFVWCTDPENNKDCELCEGGSYPAKRAFTNVLDRTTGKVRILQMTTQLANSVIGKVKRPVTTADYEIWREGADKEHTKYGADRMDASKCDISRYKLHDIEAALIAEFGSDPNAEEEEEEPRSSKSRPAKKGKSSRHEDEDDAYDDEEEVDQYAELDRSELKAEIKKYDPDFVAKKSQTDEDLLDILHDLVEPEEDEDEEEEEEEEEERPRSRRSSPPPKKSPAKRSVRKPREDALDEFKPEKTRNPVPRRRVTR